MKISNEAPALRRVGREDITRLWQWRNDPLVRASAFQSEPVPWETHVTWFQGKLASAATRIWILELAGEPAGQVRYDAGQDAAEIDYSVAAPFRGRGLGVLLLRLSAPLACAELGVGRLVGIVKADNHASRRSFERAGFIEAGPIVHRDVPCVRFEWSCARRGAA